MVPSRLSHDTWLHGRQPWLWEKASATAIGDRIDTRLRNSWRPKKARHAKRKGRLPKRAPGKKPVSRSTAAFQVLAFAPVPQVSG